MTKTDSVIEFGNNVKLEKFNYEFGNNRKIRYYYKMSLGFYFFMIIFDIYVKVMLK